MIYFEPYMKKHIAKCLKFINLIKRNVPFSVPSPTNLSFYKFPSSVHPYAYSAAL